MDLTLLHLHGQPYGMVIKHVIYPLEADGVNKGTFFWDINPCTKLVSKKEYNLNK